MSKSISKTNDWRQRKRDIIDRSARIGISIGGAGIIFAVALIFFYLLWVVIPIFSSASVEPGNHYSLAPEGQPSNGELSNAVAPSLYVAIEDSGEMGMRVNAQGKMTFFLLDSGKITEELNLEIPAGKKLVKIQPSENDPFQLALLLDTEEIQFVRVRFRVSFEQKIKHTIPRLVYPYTEALLKLSDTPLGITSLRHIVEDDRLVVTALTDEPAFYLREYTIEEDEPLDAPKQQSVIELDFVPQDYLMDAHAQWLYLLDPNGNLHYYDTHKIKKTRFENKTTLISDGTQVTAISLLSGGVSVLVLEDSGKLSQWFLIRDKVGNYHLTQAKSFHPNLIAKHIIPEQRRKGMLVMDDQGSAVVMNATSERELLRFEIPKGPYQHALLSPRADKLLLENRAGEFSLFNIHNPYPEISWKVIWEEIWYEGYQEPKYLWQSTSATNDFEPKFSLVPLAFGTIKAAFYAMLFAVPLSIMGAIYTAYFMEPKMRNWVKPSIEIMEALPTVILGFLAGLWLAPIVEQHLLAIVSLFLIMPLGILLFGWVWLKTPRSWICCWGDGWYAALLVPVMLLLGWAALGLAPFIEHWLFGGNIQTWFRNEFGIGYDQRNAIVVGIAMGVAVVPTIYSITEDAIFSVPRYLTIGSLALGATPWQTLIRVVILTASPGIFSAVMIGLGRAVGETMIVLMATGNTPVMDFSVFQGMRTLSANVAVELPESELGGSHYRILFLAALVLFAVTFIFNTTAEIVRQRLRRRYSNL